MNDNAQKLAKLMVKAEECTTHKKAKKVLKKVAKVAKKIQEEREPGVWVVRTATVIPDNERWLHEPAAAERLQAAMAWSASHPPADADLEDMPGPEA